MVWKDVSVADQKVSFIADARRKDSCFSAVCKAYGISRVTGYKWLNRFLANGAKGLEERSHAAHKKPNRWDDSVRQEVFKIRKTKGHWGGRKIHRFMRRRSQRRKLPAPSTIDRWLKDAGLIMKRQHPRRARASRDNDQGKGIGLIERPNQTWCADFKGEFKLGDGRLCYPLTVTDAYSRFLLGCFALPGALQKESTDCFKKLFKTFGIPECIHTDNGVPFAGSYIGNHSSLSVLWLMLGIEVERSRMGRPQDNGRHERMHRTLKRETTRPPRKTMGAQQKLFNQFQKIFNNERPHEGIDNAVPADIYKPSKKRMPKIVKHFTYPGHFEVRKVSTNGCISFGHPRLDINIGKAFTGMHVGLRCFDDFKWRVYLGNMEIGVLYEHTGILKPYCKNLKPPDKRLRNYPSGKL